MSSIHGKGYGDSHDWVRGYTNETSSWQDKCTNYKCANCGAVFSHYYDIVGDIFEAIERSGAVDVCPTHPKENPKP